MHALSNLPAPSLAPVQAKPEQHQDDALAGKVDKTMEKVTAKERSRAIARTGELYSTYRRRLSCEKARGPRSRDEELLYPSEIRAAAHLDGKNQYLQKEDQRLLAIAAKLRDPRAREILLMANQHAAIRIAKRVQRKDASLHDMVQSTNLGLLHALELYDPHNSQDASFLTFAVWHGWQRAMRDGQSSGRTGLSVPPYMDQICDKVRHVRLRLQQAHQRDENDIEELLELVNDGRSLKNLIEREELIRACNLLQVSYQPLDCGWVNDEDGRSFSERIGHDETEAVVDRMDDEETVERLKAWLKEKLGPDYDLYVRNQGLFGHHSLSVAELADRSELSRNQVALRIRAAKKLVARQVKSGGLTCLA